MKPRLSDEQLDALKTVFIPVDSATYFQGAVIAASFHPDSRVLVCAELYSSLHAARLNKAEGLIGEDFQSQLTPAQVKAIELKIEEIELAKEMAQRALRDDHKRSRTINVSATAKIPFVMEESDLTAGREMIEVKHRKVSA